MIALLLPALALTAAPVQMEAAAPLAPAEQAVPVALPVLALEAAPAAVQTADAPAELNDALADPAADRVVPPLPQPVRRRHARGDSLEGLNRAMFGVHQALDKAIYHPASQGYKAVVPRPVRSGLRNFFSNLTEPIAFLNYLLQLKPGRAVKTLARFTINSTVGLAGFVDVAKAKDVALPHVPNGFGNTLARYGVGPGPYLFFPFVGPTTLRDFAGGPVDGAVLPVAIGLPFDRAEYQLASGLLTGLDRRVEADADLRALFDGAVDPYATLRSVFLQSRAAEVEDIRHPRKPVVEGAVATAAPDAGALADPLADPAVPEPAKP